VFPEPGLYPMTDMHLAGLNGFDIVLSGYWEVPADTTPERAREIHGTDAEAILYEMAAEFSHAGASTDVRLQFGPAGAAERDYQSRLVDETDADGVLLAEDLASFLTILVPLRDSRHQAQIVDFVSGFHADDLFVVELYHVASDEADVESAETMLRTVERTLLDRGFSEADLEVTVEVARDAKAAIAAHAREHHLAVIGETEQPGTEDQLFGPVCTYIAEESGTPVVSVQE
jgi:hypothetical protein